MLVGDPSSAGWKLAMINPNDWYRADLDESPTCTEPAGHSDCISRYWNILLVSNMGDDTSGLLESLFSRISPPHVTRTTALAQAKACIATEIYDAIVVFLEPMATFGIETCRQLCSAYRQIPIVLLARDLDDDLLGQCIESGAQDCLGYNQGIRTELRRAIRLAIDRTRQRGTCDPNGPTTAKDVNAMTRVAQLTARQRQVLDLLVQGRPLKQIAAKLDIGVQTASKHRAQILNKCEVDSVAQLVRLTFAAGLSMN
jgi:DNA-binding NarL/FixJ family response regulator